MTVVATNPALGAPAPTDPWFTTAEVAYRPPPDDLYDPDDPHPPRFLSEEDLYDDLPPMSRVDQLEWELWAGVDQDAAEQEMLRLKAPAWVFLPPGAELAAALEELRPEHESPVALIEAMKAASRMEAWAASIKAAAMASFYRQRKAQAADIPRPTQLDSHGRPIDPERSWSAEIAAALKLSPQTVGRHIDTALHLTGSLTATHTALRCGALTWSKALAISEATRPLPPAAASAVESHVLRRAPGQTHANLNASLRRQVAKHTTRNPTPGEADAHRAATADRTCKIVPLSDGMAGLWVVHTADKIQQMWAVIQAMATLAKRPTPTPTPTPSPDPTSSTPTPPQATPKPAPAKPGLHEPAPPKPGPHEPAPHEPHPQEPDPHELGIYKPSRHKPSTAEPRTHKPDTQEPDAQEPGTLRGRGAIMSRFDHEPGTPKPGTPEPSTQEPVIHGPVTHGPSIHEPSIHKPNGQEPGASKPATQEPGPRTSPTREFDARRPAAHKPGRGGPGIDEPRTQEPNPQEPDAQAPAVRERAAEPKRTAEQRRADAVCDLFEHMLHNGLDWLGRRLPDQHRRRPHIEVLVPITTLLGMDDDPCELTGYGPIPADMARRIATNGTWRRLLTDPTNGTVLEAATTRHDPGVLVTETLLARHPVCAWPGCNRTSRECHRDHATPFAQSGQTHLAGLVPYCDYHHVIKDTPAWGWTTTPHPDGSVTLTTPTGHRYTTVPPARGPIAPRQPPHPTDHPPSGHPSSPHPQTARPTAHQPSDPPPF
ncbi:DUF222 domain-containing protein [Kribbella sp. NPDC003557]|uniref:HNH endonuclease signature motif containing protein n=1 Tax=Kribbella sp. NPDC003557 TaxID=3154449 RepID=UPI0033BE0C17